MAERKITCPNCLSDTHCFEEDMNQVEDFKSYMCFNCGFTSNSSFTENSDTLKKLLDNSTQLVRDVILFDYDRKITWVPTTLNMGKLGIIFPEGTKEDWVWKYAKIVKIPKEEQKNYPIPNKEGNFYESRLDIEGAQIFKSTEFLDACKAMGIVDDNRELKIKEGVFGNA